MLEDAEGTLLADDGRRGAACRSGNKNKTRPVERQTAILL